MHGLRKLTLGNIKLTNNDLERLSQCAGRILIAYSGGVDSHVLLHLVAKLRGSIIHSPVLALHINHGIYPEANTWQAHCERQCAELDVPILCYQMRVADSGSFEARAREARYRAFAAELQASDVLLLAHHQDDQIETILLNLLRGSGRFGVQGMPAIRPLGQAVLFRPLLHLCRAKIEQYARQYGLVWVSDPMNADQHHDRNYLRHRIIPHLNQRWPRLTQSLLNQAASTKNVADWLDSMAVTWLTKLTMGPGKLDAIEFQKLNIVLQKTILRQWLMVAGRAVMPSERGLEAALQMLLSNQADTSPLFNCQDLQLRSYRGFLYLIQKFVPVETDGAWQPGEKPLNNGVLTSSLTKGQGLLIDDAKKLTIRYRQAGEYIRLHCNQSGHKSLKKIFQEQNIPPFLRNHLPLIYVGEKLVALSGVSQWQIPCVVAQDYQAKATTTGYLFDWSLPTDNVHIR